LSFAGLAPEQIRKGLEILGRVVTAEIENAARGFAPALV
jgi:hypothetical protein